MVQDCLYLGTAEANSVRIQNQADALLHARGVPVSTSRGWGAAGGAEMGSPALLTNRHLRSGTALRCFRAGLAPGSTRM